MAWLDQVKRRLASKRIVQRRHWDHRGLQADEGDSRTYISWSDVRRVHAYKRDCLAVDQIRLIFLSDDLGIEFTEDDAGFSELRSMMSEKLGIREDWLLRLIQAPAFETALMTIYPEIVENVKASEQAN
jgi:hypothetical protein